MVDDITRAKRKLVAIRRAERRLMHRLEDIDYEIDELMPEVEAIAVAAAQGELPQFILVDKDDNKS